MARSRTSAGRESSRNARNSGVLDGRVAARFASAAQSVEGIRTDVLDIRLEVKVRRVLGLRKWSQPSAD